MIVAVMQPYLFPYIGYFQLIAACDVFVLFDDVQYLRRGWINRNRILLDGEPRWLTLPVHKAPVETSINAMRYRLEPDTLSGLSDLMRAAYAKAPRWAAARELYDEVMACQDDNVARFNEHGLRTVCAALGLERTFLRASELGRDTSLRAQDGIIDICRRLKADRYVNAIGGVSLYDPAEFARHGLQLQFVRPEPPPYAQFGGEHAPYLSILDVLMFCEPAQAQALLAARSILVPDPAGAPP